MSPARRPVWALHVLVVGLALHNVVMAELWAAGVRGTALDVLSAWRELVLVVALVLAIRARGRLPLDRIWADWLAVAFAGFAVLYALLPQDWLGGSASHHGIVLGLRHAGLPVAAYFLGRALDLTGRELRSVFRTIILTAAAVAAFGLVDVYAIPLQWWRDSGAPGWFREQLGFGYRGLSSLPENWVYNTGNEHPLRRLVSTFLSPLASSYLFVVALLAATAWMALDRLRGWMLLLWCALVALLFAGLLWTHSRSSYLALALGLVVYALLRHGRPRAERLAVVAGAFAVVLVGAAFVRAYPSIGPTTSFTPCELEYQRSHAKGALAGKGDSSCVRAGVPAGARRPHAARLAVAGPASTTESPSPAVNGLSDASIESHWESLREGVRVVVHHPQGFGLGNAGSTAARTGLTPEAGESTYTELAVETGLLGGLVFVAWSLALLWRVRHFALVAAAFVAVLALALQTDVIGVPWLACVLWALAGSRVAPRARE